MIMNEIWNPGLSNMPMPMNAQSGFGRLIGGVGSMLGSSALGLIGGLPGMALSMGVNWLSSKIGQNQAQKAQDQYMEKWGSPQAQMQNMQEAGINPFTAAQGISGAAGSSNYSASPVQEGAAGAMNSLDNAISNPLRQNELNTNIGRTQAQTEESYARTKYTNETLAPILDSINIDNWIKNNFASRSAEIYDLDVKTVKAQWDNLKATFNKIIAETYESYTRSSLNESGEALTKANTQKVGIEAAMQAFDLTMKQLGLDPNDPVCLAFKHSIEVNGGKVDDATFDELVDAHEKMTYGVEKGKKQAESLYNYGMFYQGKLVKNEKDLTAGMNDAYGRINKIVRNLSFNGVEATVRYNDKGDITVTYKGDSKDYAVVQWKKDIQKIVGEYNQMNGLLRENRQRGSVKSGTLRVPFMG